MKDKDNAIPHAYALSVDKNDNCTLLSRGDSYLASARRLKAAMENLESNTHYVDNNNDK